MPTSNKDSTALYHPAINQVWISGDISEDDLALIHAHESMHVYTTALQPSQLLLLRAELLGSIARPGKDCFDEIVETVGEACFWAQTRLEIEDIPYMIQDAKYPDTFSKLIEFGQIIASNAPQDMPKEKALKEAVVGVCTLLMHIIPHHPDMGLELIQIMNDLPVPKNCQNSWLVFQYLHRELNAKWQKENKLKKRFSLTLPKDSHRFISDMVIFLFGALKVVHHRPEIITAVFPVLLLLLTQASFVLLPFIYIKKIKEKYTAKIKVIHSTQKSDDDLYKTISLYKEIMTRNKEKGIFCGAAPIFISLINESTKYRVSDTGDRACECFSALLKILPGLLRAHILTKNNCPGCCTVFQGDIFESAIETIINMSESTKQKMIKSAKEYDTFLTTDAMYIIQDAWELNSTPQAFRSYDFL